GVDPALGRDRVRAPRGVLVAEGLHAVARLAERRGGRAARKTGADDDDGQLAAVRRVDEARLVLARGPLLGDRDRRCRGVGDRVAHGEVVGHQLTHPKKSANAGSRIPKTMSSARTVAVALSSRRRPGLVLAPRSASAAQNPCRRWKPTAAIAMT